MKTEQEKEIAELSAVVTDARAKAAEARANVRILERKIKENKSRISVFRRRRWNSIEAISRLPEYELQENALQVIELLFACCQQFEAERQKYEIE